MDKPLLKVCGLKKSFGGVEVLHSIDFPAPFSPTKAVTLPASAIKSIE